MIDYIKPPGEKNNLKRPNGLNEGNIEITAEKYYTLSKKGITTYHKGTPESYEHL